MSLEDIEDIEEVSINLLLTYQCNLACDHCMYMCSPSRSPEYISNEVLWSIRDEVEKLEENDTIVRINLVGGEPTLNMTEFERVWREVNSWGVPVEMTTNGWWAENPETFKEFLRITKNDILDTDMYVRISNSVWHESQRTPMHQKLLENFKSILQEPHEVSDYFGIDPDPECPHCGETGLEENEDSESWDDEYLCPHCEGTCSNEEYYEACDESIGDFSWAYQPELAEHIYLDTKVDERKIARTGRAKKLNFGSQAPSCYNREETLTFDYKGNVREVCSVGGQCPTMTVSDGIEHLIKTRQSFIAEVKASGITCCGVCPKVLKAWKRKQRKNTVTENLREEEVVV